MHEDRLTAPGKHDVGFARQVFAMKAEPVASPVQQRTQQHFRLGVFAANLAHVLAAALRIELIHGRLYSQVQRQIRNVFHPLALDHDFQGFEGIAVPEFFDGGDELGQSEVIDAIDIAGAERDRGQAAWQRLAGNDHDVR